MEIHLQSLPLRVFLIKKNNIDVNVQRVVCCSHQSDRLGYVSRSNQIAALGYVSRTNQSVVFVLWFERCLHFKEEMGDSKSAVRKMESSFRMRNVGLSVFLTFFFYRALWKMRYYWTDERYQITYGKRVTHAVKIRVDSCSRENGALCTVARSWLLFLHDEWVEKFWFKYCLRCWWIAPNIFIWAVL